MQRSWVWVLFKAWIFSGYFPVVLWLHSHPSFFHYLIGTVVHLLHVPLTKCFSLLSLESDCVCWTIWASFKSSPLERIRSWGKELLHNPIPWPVYSIDSWSVLTKKMYFWTFWSFSAWKWAKLHVAQIYLEKVFATWQHAFLFTSTMFYNIFARGCAEIKI